MAGQRKAILVLGMHRSGTSALTRVISLLGADLPSNLMPAREDNNEAGFWESTDIAVLNDQLLETLDSSWDDWTACDLSRLAPDDLQRFEQRALEILERDFSGSAIFVLKDPRICRLIGFWHPLLLRFGCDVRCVLSIRHPLEVAASLQKRDGFVPLKSCLLWLRHMLDAEQATRELPRLVLPYDALLQHWRLLLEPMTQVLGLDVPVDLDARAAEIDDFLRPGLRHHAADDGSLSRRPEIVDWVGAAYDGFLAMHAQADKPAQRATLGAIRRDFDAACRIFGAAFSADIVTRRGLTKNIKDLQGQLDRTRSELHGRIAALERNASAQAAAAAQAQQTAQAQITKLEQASAAAARESEIQQRIAAVQQRRALRVLAERDQLALSLAQQRHRRWWHRWLRPLGMPVASKQSWWTPQWSLPPRHGFGARLNLSTRLRLNLMARRLLASGLFDPYWYLQAYPDIVTHGADPLWHWLSVGWREGRKPNAMFDTSWYLMRNPDVAAAGVNPLLHYLTHGAEEGRQPGPLFDAAGYLARNPDVARAGLNPLAHYLVHGVSEARQPNSHFVPDWYLQQHPDVARSGVDPLRHYQLLGGFEGRKPGPQFDGNEYLARNLDVLSAGANPLEHYLGWGIHERRAGTPQGTQNVWKPADPAQMQLPTPAECFPGQRAAQAGFANVALFAHAASAQLFGGERSFIDLLQMLADGPYNVHVVVPRRDQAYIDAVATLAVEVAYIPGQTWAVDREPDAMAIAAIRTWLLRRRIALVHVNTITSCEPLIAARRLRIPTATHVRESVVADPWISQRIGLPPAAIIREVVARSDIIIANSEQSGTEFAKPGCTFVVPNTFDLAELDLPNPVDPRRIYVGLISSNIIKKGVQDFAELARACATELPQLRFRLIGPHNEQVRLLEQRQQSGDLPMNLEFVGYQNSPSAALAQVNIVMSLSHFAESFGRTVAEGLAARRPAIVYDLGAAKDLVQPGQSGFVIPYGQWQAAIEPLRQLCANPQTIATMGEAGRAHVAARYARKHGAQALRAAYAAMLSGHVEGDVSDVVVPAVRYSQAQPVAEQAQKLAYFCWHFPVPSETFVLNELRELVARGVDVRVYCRQSPHKDFTPDFAITWQQVTSVEDLAQRLQQDGRDIVHAHFTYPTVTDMVWPACEQAQIPFTFIAHAQDIFKHENDRRNRIGELSMSPLCRAVFVLGRFHRDYLIERGVPAAKLIINANAIDPSRFTYRGPRRRAPGERVRVCAIHRYTEKKGLRYLVLAAKRLEAENVEFNLYGYGEEEAALRALAEEHAVGNLRFCGALETASQVAEVMHEHDLFACPSVRTASGDMDGIPTSVVEAMACGTPVITTDLASIPDLVTDELTGIVVKSADVDSLVDGVRRFIDMDADAVAAMTCAAQAAALANHAVDRRVSVLQRVWSDTPVDIVIVSWNNLAELREVIRRVFAYTRTPFHLTVCDNASKDDVVQFLCALQCAYDNVSVVYRRMNSFVGPGTNAAIAQGRAPYVIYLCGKEGFVLAEGWETGLISYMDAHPTVGVGGTLCYSPSYLTGALYPSIREFPRFREQAFAAENPDRLFHHVQGGLFIMRRRMLDEIGGFSDAVPHAYTDVEFSYYAEAKGWQLGQVPGMLALYNKTRPDIWSRIDESMKVIHPPRLQDLALLDSIVAKTTSFCNVCQWAGADFAGEHLRSECPQCASLPVHRSLYRYLAESTLTYRRLRARLVQAHQGLESAIRKAFELQSADQAARLAVLMDVEFRTDAPDVGIALADLLHQLEPDGELLIFGTDDVAGITRFSTIVQSLGYEVTQVPVYVSAVVRYASAPLFVVRKGVA